MTAASHDPTVAVPAVSPQDTLLSGRHIHFQSGQTAAWSTVLGLLAACFIAGLYFLVLQVDWHVFIPAFRVWFVHFPRVRFRVFYLKNWWDSGMGIVHSANWPLYRHVAFRDIPEPAIATMAVRTLLTKPRYWESQVRPWRLLTAPLVLLALTFSMGVGGVWLLDFGGPNAWHHLFGNEVVRYSYWLGRLSAGQIALGIIIGQVLHRFWAPIGATLQGYPLDRAVDRAQATGRIPLWERLPIMAPPIRLRFAKMYRENTDVSLPGRSHRRILAAFFLFVIVVTLAGIMAKYFVAHGHAVPYFAPGAL